MIGQTGRRQISPALLEIAQRQPDRWRVRPASYRLLQGIQRHIRLAIGDCPIGPRQGRGNGISLSQRGQGAVRCILRQGRLRPDEGLVRFPWVQSRGLAVSSQHPLHIAPLPPARAISQQEGQMSGGRGSTRFVPGGQGRREAGTGQQPARLQEDCIYISVQRVIQAAIALGQPSLHQTDPRQHPPEGGRESTVGEMPPRHRTGRN